MSYKGSYIVNENGERPLTFKDHSFKLCIGTMLVFIFLCTVLITASLLFWNKSTDNADKLLGVDSNTKKGGLIKEESESKKNGSIPKEEEHKVEKLNNTANVDTKPDKNIEDKTTTKTKLTTLKASFTFETIPRTTESGTTITTTTMKDETTPNMPTDSGSSATTTVNDKTIVTNVTESRSTTSSTKLTVTESASTISTTTARGETNVTSATESGTTITTTTMKDEITPNMTTDSESAAATTTAKDETSVITVTEPRSTTSTTKLVLTESASTISTTTDRSETNVTSATESGTTITTTTMKDETTPIVPTDSGSPATTTVKDKTSFTNVTEPKSSISTTKLTVSESASIISTTTARGETNVTSATESETTITTTTMKDETTPYMPTESGTTSATTTAKDETSVTTVTEPRSTTSTTKLTVTESASTISTTTDRGETNVTSATELGTTITTTTIKDEKTPIMPTDSGTTASTTTAIYNATLTLPRDLKLNVCKTGTCKNTASRILALMDHTVNPCDDFYQYVCGGMVNNKIDEKNLEKNVMDILEDVEKNKFTNTGLEVLNKFYKSCVKESVPTNYYKTFFNDLQNDLNITDSEENKPTNLAILLSNILQNHPHHTPGHPFPIIDVVVDADHDKHFIPVITQPFYPSILKNADNNDVYKKECYNYLFDKHNFSKSYDNYKDCTKHSILYMKNLNASFKYFNIFDIEAEDRAYFNIDDLNKVLKSSNNRIKVDIKRNAYESDAIYYTFGELKAKYPVINWELLFQKLFLSKTISDKQKIKILTPKYFEEIMEFYKFKEFHKIKEILLGIMSHDLYLEFIVPKVYDRKSYCKEIMINLLDDIVFNKYNVDNLKKNTNLDRNYQEVNNFFQKIKDKMSDLLDEYVTENLSPDDATTLKQALDTIRLVIDTKTLYNDRKINLNYATLILNETDFMENVMLLKRKLRRKMYSNFNEIIDKDNLIWQHFTSPLATEPFVHINLNIIVVSPIVLFDLLPNYGNNKKPRYQQMADLGFLLGQQLATFFTPINIKKILLTYPDDYESFIIQLNSLPTLYIEYYGEKLTVNETALSSEKRFTDDSGFHILYQLFSDDNGTLSDIENYKLPWVYNDFDNNQLFFILLAQNFCERKEKLTKENFIMNLYENDELQNDIRVNSMISNSKPMKNVFHCGLGTNMTPDSKFGQFPDIKPDNSDYDI